MGFKEKKRWLFFGLPFTFTRYTIEEDMITINKGFLKTEEDDCYMYKVQDVKLQMSFMERLASLGTVVCYTGDSTDKNLQLVHIKNAKAIKDFILTCSESERRKRRTLNTLDIGVGTDVDLADID